MDIISFKHKGLRPLFERNECKGLPPDRIRKIRQLLTAIDSAENIEELETLPGWRLHQLHGSRVGTWSIVVTGNYRLTFTIKDEQIYNLNLEDYH